MTAREFESNLMGLENKLHNYARTLTQNEEDANDLTQETFLKVLENREKFDPSTNLKAWTYTIMKNTFINAYRRIKRSSELMDTSENSNMTSFRSSIHEERPDSTLQAKEILQAITTLSSDHRQSFQMFYEGYKYQEIADILHLSIGTVKSRIFFSRKKLMEKLQSYVC